MSCVGHVEGIRKVRSACKILVGNLKGRDKLEDLGIDKDIELDMGLKGMLKKRGLHLSGSEQRSIAGFSGRENELSGSTKCKTTS